MAWWNTQLLFLGDQLIAEGINPLSIDDYDTVIVPEAEQPKMEAGAGESAQPSSSAYITNDYTRVIVSGYALYGKLRGYYALGVAHWKIDPAARRIFMTENSQHDIEPVSSLTAAQRAILRECLIDLSPEAWDTSTGVFRQQLES